MSSKAPLTITALEVENVKRLRAVRITPEGKTVVVGGRNGAGKSSILDAIEMALGGKDADAFKHAPEPVRRGEKSARIVCTLGDLVVTREFSADGKSTLTVASPDGAKYSSPQKMLDELVGRLSFDPLAYSRLKPAAQYEELAALVGINFTLLDRRRAQLFDDRTGANRDVKRLKAQLDGMPHHEDAPAEVVSITEISDAIKAAQELDRAAQAAQRASDEAERALSDAEAERASIEDDISDLEAEIAKLRERIARHREQLARNLEQVPDLRAAAAEASAAALQAVQAIPDVAPLHQQLQEAEGTNRRVRENVARAALAAELAEASAKADDLTSQIEAIDAQKHEQIANTQFPVDGLSVKDGVVTLDGIPFDQASQAQKLRVSCALGLALNPKLRVLLIRDGALLDLDSLRMLAEQASEKGAQLFLERVGDGAEVGIVIEDGEIREVRQAAE